MPFFPAHGAETSPDSAPRTPDGAEYAELSRLVRQAGLLQRRRLWYVWKIAGTAVALAAGWALFALAGDSWWQLAVAVFLAVVFAQIGFLGHDAGHRQIFSTRRSNYLLGVVCGNLAIGLSYGWWVAKHNRHHAHPNTEGEDPDIMISVLAFSSGQARAAAGLRRLIFRYQAYLMLPMLFFEAAGLHGSSIRALTSRGTRSARAARRRAWEAGLLTVHVAGYLSAVFVVLSPVRAVVFILIQQGLFGFYLGCAFAPNHKGMPVLSAGERAGFLQRQVLTSRNVRGGWLTDAALGGLNYQIEHHLFPSMPRPNLRHAQPLVAGFCAGHGLPYTQATLLGSYAQALRHLNAVGKVARPASAISLPSQPARPAGRTAPHPAIPAAGEDRGSSTRPARTPRAHRPTRSSRSSRFTHAGCPGRPPDAGRGGCAEPLCSCGSALQARPSRGALRSARQNRARALRLRPIRALGSTERGGLTMACRLRVCIRLRDVTAW